MSGTMDSEEFCISWNDHHTNVVGVLGRYLDEGTLVDCTIAAEGKDLKAHRLILSACSSYFELLFSHEMKQENVLVLEDIKFEDLKSLIAFIYDGKVTIPKNRLRGFARAAEILQIKGMSTGLSQNSQRETSEMSLECKNEGLASRLSHDHMRCAIGSDRSDVQCASSFDRIQTADEVPSTCMQMDLSEENVFPQAQSVLKSGPNRKTTVFTAVKEPSVEPKEEVNMEDTPIWESEDENSSAVTDVSSATAGEEIQNELTPAVDTISSKCSFISSPHILEKQSETSMSQFSSFTAAVPFPMNTADSSSFVSNLPTELGCCAMEDSFSFVQTEMAEQIICIKDEAVAKTEVIPAVVSLHKESIVEPMHEVWMEEVRSWDDQEVITETDSAGTCYQGTMSQDLVIAAVATPGNNQPAVCPNVISKASASCVITQTKKPKATRKKATRKKATRRKAQSNKKKVHAPEVKEEIEIDKRYMVQESNSIEVNGSTVDKMEVIRQQNIEIHEDNVEREEHVIEEQEMLEEKVEIKLDTDIAVEQGETEEEDSAPLSERILQILGKKSQRCPQCPDVFRTVGELRLHVKKMHIKEHSNRCDVCLATFPIKSQLITHMRKHTGERPFQCEVCGRFFRVKDVLKQHMRTHTGERPFQCNICNTSFGHRTQLIRHKHIHTGKFPFHCDICKMSFSDRSSLTVHRRTHTGERPYLCDFCSMSFTQSISLLVHRRIHTGERPYRCDVCCMSFGQKAYLTVHKRIHTGERPFQCDVCTTSFSQKISLIVHKRIHSDDRPYECDVCGMTFSQKSYLTVHKRTHTGERPFQCDVCTMSFSQKFSLTVHKRIHTGERPYVCDVCKMSFIHKYRLTKHMSTHTV